MANGIHVTDPSIRLVLTGSCQSGCNFCHLEGNRPSGYYGLHPDIAGWKEKDPKLPLLQRLAYAANEEDVEFVVRVCKLLKIRKVHLTGGEPTLHPKIEKFVKYFKDNDLHVAVTTHGEYPAEKLNGLFKSGIDSVIFSLHCASEEEYLTMDLMAQKIEEKFGLEKSMLYARTRLQMKKKNIELSLDRSKKIRNFEVVANSVIRDSSPSIAVIRYCNEFGLPIRLQKEMNKPWESERVISEIISILNAKKISTSTSFDDSSRGGTDYQYKMNNGQKGFFRIKVFAHAYLQSICGACRLRNTPKCRERFYGVRIQRGHVRLCIDRHDEKILYTFQDFLNNKNRVIDELKNQYNVL